MRVEPLMTKAVLKVRMDDSIGTIREILEHVKFHHLLVVQGQKLVGIMSDRDILRAISPFLHTSSEQTRDLSILNKKVDQIMTRNPITVDRDTRVETAARLLLENNIGCLPGHFT